MIYYNKPPMTGNGIYIYTYIAALQTVITGGWFEGMVLSTFMRNITEKILEEKENMYMYICIYIYTYIYICIYIYSSIFPQSQPLPASRFPSLGTEVLNPRGRRQVGVDIIWPITWYRSRCAHKI